MARELRAFVASRPIRRAWAAQYPRTRSGRAEAASAGLCAPSRAAILVWREGGEENRARTARESSWSPMTSGCSARAALSETSSLHTKPMGWDDPGVRDSPIPALSAPCEARSTTRQATTVGKDMLSDDGVPLEAWNISAEGDKSNKPVVFNHSWPTCRKGFPGHSTSRGHV
jgi:hypothetical protein